MWPFKKKNWEYKSEPTGYDDREKAYGKNFGQSEELLENHFYRYDRSKDRLQVLDIDGWCDPIYKPDVQPIIDKLFK